MSFVIAPGLNGSDHQHWQSRWEADWLPGATRVQRSSWTEPSLPDWTRAIETAVDQAGPDVVLVAHSLGCLAVADWLTSRVRSASPPY
ncbi:alpha/beta hydrolase [Kribbella qitaiheensis]|uniref:RBBP9/YdeN family alpha/beta hydrolase n=1 Tax=Kribbella qitaiheensis TaxID=1544730 RepID=UPI0019D5327E